MADCPETESNPVRLTDSRPAIFAAPAPHRQLNRDGRCEHTGQDGLRASSKWRRRPVHFHVHVSDLAMQGCIEPGFFFRIVHPDNRDPVDDPQHA